MARERTAIVTLIGAQASISVGPFTIRGPAPRKVRGGALIDRLKLIPDLAVVEDLPDLPELPADFKETPAPPQAAPGDLVETVGPLGVPGTVTAEVALEAEAPRKRKAKKKEA